MNNMTQQAMKVVSIINYKGGVGKTTLTANLGAYAAMKGYRVLLIDLDPQTHLTFSFMTPEYWAKKYADTKTLKNYFEPIIKGSTDIPPFSSLTIPLKAGNFLNINNVKLDLISSHLELINIDIELAGLLGGTTPSTLAANSLKVYNYLRNELRQVKDDYDLVLIDCPPNFYVMVKNAILSSDYYLVPARLDYLSTLGVTELNHKITAYLNQYDEYIKILGDGKYMPVFLTMLGVVPMMVNIAKGDELVSVQKSYMDSLVGKGIRIFHYVRNNPSVFGSAPFDGVPAVLTRPRFNLTAKRIITELYQLGDEFLTAIKLHKRGG